MTRSIVTDDRVRMVNSDGVVMTPTEETVARDARKGDDVES